LSKKDRPTYNKEETEHLFCVSVRASESEEGMMMKSSAKK